MMYLIFQGRNKATSSLGVLNTYDFLFDRHLRMLTTMESDQEDMINEEEIKTLRSIQQPLAVNPAATETEEESNDECKHNTIDNQNPSIFAECLEDAWPKRLYQRALYGRNLRGR